jgi:DNA-directed RNA polymerase subunit beta'
VQFKLLGTTTNLVGRGVVAPDPNLDMDSIGIPEDQAWEVYKPFIVRELVRRGMPRLAVLKAVEDKAPAAKDALLQEMDRRPVLVNRYPILHKYGLMAFWPKLVKGSTIKVSPIITKPFGMDFDGDTSQFHVPVGEDARIEAIEKMLPSRNLFASGNFKVLYTPHQEYIQGLHAASTMQDASKIKRTFATKEDALRAYRRGEIGLGTQVEIIG